MLTGWAAHFEVTTQLKVALGAAAASSACVAVFGALSARARDGSPVDPSSGGEVMAFLASAACSLSSSALQSANVRATVMYTITKFPIHFDLASSAVGFGVAGGSSGGGGASADAGTFGASAGASLPGTASGSVRGGGLNRPIVHGFLTHAHSRNHTAPGGRRGVLAVACFLCVNNTVCAVIHKPRF